jgi:hypothetical protein
LIRIQKSLIRAVISRNKKNQTANKIIDHRLNPSIIEVYNNRENLVGFVEECKYLDENKNIVGYLDGMAYKLPNGFTLLSLDEDNFITDESEEDIGYFENNYFRFPKEWISFALFITNNIDRGFSKEKGELYDHKGTRIGYLLGDYKDLTYLDYFGILSEFYDLGA